MHPTTPPTGTLLLVLCIKSFNYSSCYCLIAPSGNVTTCPLGTYQPESQGDCLPCPLNTNTSVENAIICPCLSGYFRAAFEGPQVDCTRESYTCIYCLLLV